MPESDDDDHDARPPLPPEDRLWRHPSELGAVSAAPPAPTAVPRRRRPLLAVGLLGGLVGAAATVVSLAAIGALSPVATESVDRAAPTPLPSTTVAVATAAATRVAPAVVHVTATAAGSVRAGSGVVARSDGLILTSAGLVDGATAVVVRWPSGREADATVEGTDALTGLAALTVDGDGYPTATLDMTPPEVGEEAITVSAGDDAADPAFVEATVASTNTHVASAEGQMVGLIGTDQPLPDGADGAALVDVDGHLRGVCVAVDGHTTGWAVPAEVALRVADDLRRLGRVDRGWLGIGGEPTAVDGTVPAGLGIAEVAAGSPAALAGLAVGDVVIAVDDERVRSLDDIKAALTLTRPGQPIVVEVARADATTVEVPVVLAAAPA